MIIDCISDLHGHFPQLGGGGDILIVAGDLTAHDLPHEYDFFTTWLIKQDYKKKIVVAGNHDGWMTELPVGIWRDECGNRIAECLCDSGTKFEGLKIWGSPWTLSFPGENPDCLAFTCKTEAELAEKWEKIPVDTDILVTHSPPFEILDEVEQGDKIVSVGSKSLSTKLEYLPNLKLHVFGHIHESYGIFQEIRTDTDYVNASHVDERYRPVNPPFRIEL